MCDRAAAWLEGWPHWYERCWDTQSEYERAFEGHRSCASTLVHEGQIPFPEFKPRVLELCRILWPDACHYQTEVEQMKGGVFHRIIGLSIAPSQGAKKTQYVLRLPRDMDDEDIIRNVAILKFIEENSEIPVPHVVKFDQTIDNSLKSQYIIYERIPGEPLCSIYPSLNFEGKCSIARQLGQICHQMLQMKSTTPGFLAPGQDEQGSTLWSMVEPFEREGGSAKIQRRDAPSDISCAETLIRLFEWYKASKAEVPGDFDADVMDAAIEMTTEIEALGCLTDNQINFWHRYLSTDKIIVESTARPIITGIFHWDAAAFAPRFASCDPPAFLWQEWNEYEYNYDEDRRLDGKLPDNAEMREIKRIFDEAAGPEYARYAYLPHYRLLRTLLDFTITSTYRICAFVDSVYRREVLVLAKEWLQIRPGGQLVEEEWTKVVPKWKRFRSRIKRYLSRARNFMALPLVHRNSESSSEASSPDL